jgi:hypothetical protein
MVSIPIFGYPNSFKLSKFSLNMTENLMQKTTHQSGEQDYSKSQKNVRKCAPDYCGFCFPSRKNFSCYYAVAKLTESCVQPVMQNQTCRYGLLTIETLVGLKSS